MACIIYWQAKEISRVIQDCDPQEANINLNLLEHVSPIGECHSIRGVCTQSQSGAQLKNQPSIRYFTFLPDCARYPNQRFFSEARCREGAESLGATIYGYWGAYFEILLVPW